MANVILKSDEQKSHEERILRDFHKTRTQGEPPTREQREAAEIISRRTAEAYAYAANANKR